MTVKEEFDAFATKVDEATTKMAEDVTAIGTSLTNVRGDIEALKSQIRNSMTDAEVADFRAKIDAQSAKLQTATTGLGAVKTALEALDNENPSTS